MQEVEMRRKGDLTAEDKMNAALWGCLGLAGIAAIIICVGGFFLFRWLLA